MGDKGEFMQEQRAENKKEIKQGWRKQGKVVKKW